MAKVKRTYADAGGTTWRVTVNNVGASNAQVIFQHPDPRRTRQNRYAHYLERGPESQNVSGRVDPAAVLEKLDDAALAHLFRRSMPIAGHPTIEGRTV